MILLIDAEEGFLPIMQALLAPFDEAVVRAADMAAAVERIGEGPPALILVARPMPGVDADGVVPLLRAAGKGDSPIVALASLDKGEGPWLARGFDGLLATPFDASTFLSAIGGWVGRSGMEMPKDDDAVAKLKPLMGEDGARTMIVRVLSSLADAVAEIDSGGDRRALGHRLGGLAGTLGLSLMSAVWLALQDDIEVWPTVRAITLEAIARHGQGSVGA